MGVYHIRYRSHLFILLPTSSPNRRSTSPTYLLIYLFLRRYLLFFSGGGAPRLLFTSSYIPTVFSVDGVLRLLFTSPSSYLRIFFSIDGVPHLLVLFYVLRFVIHSALPAVYCLIQWYQVYNSCTSPPVSYAYTVMAYRYPPTVWFLQQPPVCCLMYTGKTVPRVLFLYSGCSTPLLFCLAPRLLPSSLCKSSPSTIECKPGTRYRYLTVPAYCFIDTNGSSVATAVSFDAYTWNTSNRWLTCHIVGTRGSTLRRGCGLFGSA